MTKKDSQSKSNPKIKKKTISEELYCQLEADEFFLENNYRKQS